MLVQSAMGVTKDPARLVSPVFNASGVMCHMSFNYHMLGDSAGMRQVIDSAGYSKTIKCS